MGKTWGDSAALYLVDWRICPRCNGALTEAGNCPECGADLTGPLGEELAEASTRAGDALILRRGIIGRLPTVWVAMKPHYSSASHSPSAT